MGMRASVAGVALVSVAVLPAMAFAVAGGGGVAGDVGTPGGEFGDPSASTATAGVGGVAIGAQAPGADAPSASVGTEGGSVGVGGGGVAGPGGATGGGGGSSVSAPEPLVWAITGVGLVLAARLRRWRK